MNTNNKSGKNKLQNIAMYSYQFLKNWLKLYPKFMQKSKHLALKRGKGKNWRVTDIFLRNLFLLSGSNYRVTKSSKPDKRHESHQGSLRSTLIFRHACILNYTLLQPAALLPWFPREIRIMQPAFSSTSVSLSPKFRVHLPISVKLEMGGVLQIQRLQVL